MCKLQRAKAALRPNGVIFVKDNVCREGRAFYYDAGAFPGVLSLTTALLICSHPFAPPPLPDDASVTRSAPYLELLFRLAGLRVVAAEDPPDWDAELLPVTHYALAPTAAVAAAEAGSAGSAAPAPVAPGNDGAAGH